MLTKRIIPCLDVRDGRVVKGVRFRDHRDAGDPITMAADYNQAGADELVFYDITASSEGRSIMEWIVARTADQVFIPLCVGGGIRTIRDIQQILRAGADKVSINTAAVENPQLIHEAASAFGSQCIVLGLDAMRIKGSIPQRWEVRIRTGNQGGVPTELDAETWASQAADLGVGEIVVNSIDGDGTKAGYDLELLKAISTCVNIPVVASGGAGTPEHIFEAISEGKADAALAASIFHYGNYTVQQVKHYLISRGLPIRPLNNPEKI